MGYASYSVLTPITGSIILATDVQAPAINALIKRPVSPACHRRENITLHLRWLAHLPVHHFSMPIALRILVSLVRLRASPAHRLHYAPRALLALSYTLADA